MHYAREWLLFASTDGSIYAKTTPHGGESGPVGLVASGFSEVTSISSMDSFIYVADKNTGIFAIETREDGSFSEVRRINPKTGMDNVKTMVTVSLKAIRGFFVTGFTIFMASLVMIV
jgi:hypothetical protein